jgi:hypothetical protein
LKCTISIATVLFVDAAALGHNNLIGKELTEGPSFEGGPYLELPDPPLVLPTAGGK